MNDTKVCQECQECFLEKDLASFTLDRRTKNGFGKRCKECDTKRRAKMSYNSYTKRNQKLKEDKLMIRDFLIARYKDFPCEDCHGVFPWCVMDFDHRPKEEKKFTIGSKGCYKATEFAIKTVMNEIDKCDLVCSNCHRIRTFITRKK